MEENWREKWGGKDVREGEEMTKTEPEGAESTKWPDNLGAFVSFVSTILIGKMKMEKNNNNKTSSWATFQKQQQ